MPGAFKSGSNRLLPSLTDWPPEKRPDVAEERSDAGHKALGFASAEAAVVLFQGEIDGHRRGHRSLHASATSVTAA